MMAGMVLFFPVNILMALAFIGGHVLNIRLVEGSLDAMT
jgi:hypothetical protein